MEIILRGRNLGKTTDLIIKAAEEYSCIVCYSKQEANRIFKQATNMELYIPFPITVTEFIEGKFHGREIESFCIDNIETLLHRLARGVKITCITANTKELEFNGKQIDSIHSGETN
jgi:hypothetical protein